MAQYHYCYRYLVFALAFACLLGCKKESSKQGTTLRISDVDSAITWIDSAKIGQLSLQTRKDFLEKAYRRILVHQNDSNKLNFLRKIQWAYLELPDSVFFRETNLTAMNLSSELNDSISLASTHWDLAYFFERNNKVDSAYYHYAIAEKIYVEKGQYLNAANMLIYMAGIQNMIKDYTGAESNTFKAIALLKPLEHNYELYSCYNLLGIISKDLKAYDRSLTYYKDANNYLKKLPFKKALRPTADNNIGGVYLSMKAYDKAISLFENAIASDSIKTKQPEVYAKAINNLGVAKFRSDATAKVEHLFREALKIRDSLGDLAGVAGSYFTQAEYYINRKDTATAILNAEKAKQYARLSSNNERLLQTLGLLAAIDKKNSAKHVREYVLLNDSLQVEERLLRDKFARIRFETNETIEQNRLLAKQKQLWTGIAVTLLMLAVASYIIIDQRLKNQKLRFQRAQQSSNEKIFTLLMSEGQKLEEGKKMEQKRISEELHDGVQGRLQGARMVLLGLNKRNTPEAVEERAAAIKELMDIQEEVRAISHELSHAAYQKMHNFISSIQDLLLGLEASADLLHSFEFDPNSNWDGLNADIKINLYRIIQESVQNCVKHAHAKKVNLLLVVKNNSLLQVTIADDGKGFVVKRGKKGIGMRNIDSRMQKLNGTWDIQSGIGQGTVITLNIPIPNSINEEQPEINTGRAFQEA